MADEVDDVLALIALTLLVAAVASALLTVHPSLRGLSDALLGWDG